MAMATEFCKTYFVFASGAIFAPVFLKQLCSYTLGYIVVAVYLIVGFFAGATFKDKSDGRLIKSLISRAYNYILLAIGAYLLANGLFVIKFGHIFSDINILLVLTMISILIVFPNWKKALCSAIVITVAITIGIHNETKIQKRLFGEFDNTVNVLPNTITMKQRSLIALQALHKKHPFVTKITFYNISEEDYNKLRWWEHFKFQRNTNDLTAIEVPNPWLYFAGKYDAEIQQSTTKQQYIFAWNKLLLQRNKEFHETYKDIQSSNVTAKVIAINMQQDKLNQVEKLFGSYDNFLQELNIDKLMRQNVK